MKRHLIISTKHIRLLACLAIIMFFYSCLPTPEKTDWQYQEGGSLLVNAETLVSSQDTSMIVGEIGGFTLSDKAVYLTDNMAMKIHVFDLSGEYIRSVGGRGRGPGEFLNMSAIAWLPLREEIAIYDHLNFRLSRLNADGTFINSCDYSPTEIEWPRSLMEIDDDHHIAVYLVSSGLMTGKDRALLHKVNTLDCSVIQSSMVLDDLNYFEKEQTFLGVFSLFSPGNLAKADDGTIIFKTGVDDRHIYKLRTQDLSIKETIAYTMPEESDPYFPATAGMEQDPRVMAISGQIASAAVIQSDLIGFGPYDHGFFYQFVMHRPSADSVALYFDVLDANQKTRTRHPLHHTLPIDMTTRRGFNPVLRILGYDLETRTFFASSFIEDTSYLLRIHLTKTP